MITRILTITLLLFTTLFAKAQIATCNASFSSINTLGATINFIPVMASSSNVSHFWDFGDINTSTNSNPSHTYSNAGIYSVKHIVKIVNNGAIQCMDTVIQNVNITSLMQDTCTANFSAINPSSSGNTVYFTALAPINPSTSQNWNFGDGLSSTQNNPNHTYATAGNYIVKLKITKFNPNGIIVCVDSTIKTIVINGSTPCNIQANFNFVKDSINRKKVYFTNTSLGFLTTDSIRWNFGDGNPFNYTTNPTHTFSNYGTYNVCIRVKRQTIATTPPCVSEICKVVVIDSILPVTCNANFTTNIVGLTATVSPMQTTQVQHQWNFGDGFTSTAITPSHTYATSGTYTIKHKILQYANSNTPICIDSFAQTITVQSIITCNIQAYYTATKDSINKKKFYFTNASSGYLSSDSVRWSFGDGTFSNDQNPTHTYTNNGMYTVCIRIVRPTVAGSAPCIREYCNIVIADSIPTTTICTANFTSTTSANVVNFTSLMPNATQHVWSFGDGTGANIANPVHTYTNGGVYIVKHKVIIYSNSNIALCADSVVKTITIAQPCNLQAYFTYTKDSVNKKKVYFSNTTVGFLATDSIRWNFGDGTAFNYTANPTHTYTNYGTYNVCIRVKRNSPNATTVPCVSEICKIVVIDSNGVVTSICNYNVDFTMRRDSSNLRKVHFTNTSNVVAGAVATWYFGDGTTATGWNVSHMYPNAGTVFQPCLRVTYSNTCSKVKCKVLQLPLNNACNLQPYPNPATSVVNGNVQLTTPLIIYTRIYNNNNLIVRQQQQNGYIGFNTVTVNVATLPFGLYRMDVQYGTQICRALFMKQ